MSRAPLSASPSAATAVICRPKDIKQMHPLVSKRFTCFLIITFFHMSILIPAARASVIDTTMYLDTQQHIIPHGLRTLLDRLKHLFLSPMYREKKAAFNWSFLQQPGAPAGYPM